MTGPAERLSYPLTGSLTTRYGIWSLTDAVRIRATEMVDADGDAEVLALARFRVERSAVEVWDGQCFVDRLELKG